VVTGGRRADGNQCFPFTGAAARKRRITAQGWLWLIPFLIGLDQLTKALAPPSRVELDPGAGTWLPSAIGQAFKGSVSGQLLDLFGCLVLPAIGVLVLPRLRYQPTLLGTTLILAGMTSNLLDRLGMSTLTQHVGGRVVVNWFAIDRAGFRFGNVADLCYGVGGTLLVLALLLDLARQGESSSSSLQTLTAGQGPLYQ